MNVLNFAFIKVHGERAKNFNFPFGVNTNLQFKEIDKEKPEATKDKEIFSITFSCTFTYEHSLNEKKEPKQPKDDKPKQAEMLLEGIVVISLEKEDSKELQKSWKKKEIPEKLRESLANIALRKCTIRALTMEDELGIPPHINLPRIKFQQ